MLPMVQYFPSVSVLRVRHLLGALVFVGLLGLALGLQCANATEVLRGRVVAIADGDTLTLLVGTQQVKVRLLGIDAPEKKQAFGTRSRQELSDCAFGKEVVVTSKGSDRYKRVLGDVAVNGESCNLRQVSAGMAWWYRKYSPNEKTLEAAEAKARQAKRGLWVDPLPTPPWEFRHAPKR